MAKKKKSNRKSRKLQHKKVARTNKKLLTIVIASVAIILVGLSALWFFVEYRGPARNASAGDALFAEGDFYNAKKQYGRAVSKEPNNLTYVEKYKKAIRGLIPVTPTGAIQAYDEYVRVLVHEARYNPTDIDIHLAIAQEMYLAAYLTGQDTYWQRLSGVAYNGLDRIASDHPRRDELLLYVGLASLRLKDASMTNTFDDEGNVRFPGEDELEEVLEMDPGNALAWATLAHGRMAVYYRLKDQGQISQAERNKLFAEETMNKAREVAGESFEVSMVLLREMLLRKNALLQKKSAQPNSVSQSDLNFADEQIEEVRLKAVRSYVASLHAARAGELTTLLIGTGEGGKLLAVEILEETLKEEPNDFGRRYLLANILGQLGRAEESEALGVSILEEEDQPVGLHSIELFTIRPIVAQSLVRSKVEESSSMEDVTEKNELLLKAKEYRALLNDLVSGDVNDRLLLYADGLILLSEKQYADAATKLEEVIRRNPDMEASVYRQVAFALSQINANGLAIERLQTAIEKEPSNLANYLAKARLEIQLSNEVAAAQTLAVLPAEARMRDDVKELLNLIAMQQQDATETDFSDPALRYIAGAEQLVRDGKYDEAIESLTSAIELAPKSDWRLFASLSNVYGAMGEKEQAVIWIEQAMELAPNPKALEPRLFLLKSDSQVDALISMVQANGRSEADQAEELAVSLYEMSIRFLGEANRWELIGNDQEAQVAREVSNGALQASVQYQTTAEELGVGMSRIIALQFNQAIGENNLEEAESLLQKMASVSTTESEIESSKMSLLLAKASDAKARGQIETGNSFIATALTIAEKMVEQNAISDSAWRALGRVLVDMEQLEEAKAAYAEAYRISPDNKENIRRYVGVLFQDPEEQQRLLRILRLAHEKYPSDQQFTSGWLEAEEKVGDRWKVIVFRQNRLVLNPEDRNNALELALSLTNTEPSRELLRDLSGKEVYSVRIWEQMAPPIQLQALRDARKNWDELIAQILDKAFEEVDPNIRTAALHATVHRNLGQLERSSEIWDKFIKAYEGQKKYTTAVIAAADFLYKSGRGRQAFELLDNARGAQSDTYEIDATLGTLQFFVGNFAEAAILLRNPVEATSDPIMQSRLIESLALDGQFEAAEEALVGYSSTNAAYAATMLKALISRVKSEQLLAQGEIEMGKIALRQYRDALRGAIMVDPNVSTPYIRLCRSLLNEYQLTQDKALLIEALAVVEEASVSGNQTEQFAVVRADVLQADGQLTRSIDRLTRFLAEEPESSLARRRLIEAYLDTDSIDRALAVAQAGVNSEPSSSVWHKQLGDLHIRANNDVYKGVQSYLQAIQREPSVELLRIIDQVTRTNQPLPDQELIALAQGALSKLDPIAGAVEAKALMNLGRKRDALLAMERSWKVFEHAIAKGWFSPDANAAWFIDLADLFQDDPAEGEKFVNALVGGELSSHQLAGLAIYYESLGGEHINKALALLDKGLSLGDGEQNTRLRLLMMRGALLVEAGRLDESEKAFRLLAKEANSPLVQNNLAYVVGVYLNRPEEGLKIAKEAAKIAPRNGSIVDTVATMYERLGEYQKAVETYDFLLQIEPTNTSAMVKIALLYADHLAQPDRGIVFAERGRSQKPRSPEVLDALGWCYYRNGNTERAKETISRSIRNGDTFEAYLHMAQIVMDDLKFEEALGHIRMAEELAQDEHSRKRNQVLKDDIRKKKLENESGT